MDNDAYHAAVLELKDRVFSYSVYMLRDREEAQDVAQEALVRLWQHKDKVPNQPAAKSWLLRTAHNLCIDLLRRRTNRPQLDIDDLDTPPPADEPSPEDRTMSKQTLGEIMDGLSSLPERDRSLLLLREVEQLSYQEMCNLLDVPIGTLKAGLHRARGRLRERLAEQGVQP